jgi:hypothetical protein
MRSRSLGMELVTVPRQAGRSIDWLQQLEPGHPPVATHFDQPRWFLRDGYRLDAHAGLPDGLGYPGEGRELVRTRYEAGAPFRTTDAQRQHLRLLGQCSRMTPELAALCDRKGAGTDQRSA